MAEKNKLKISYCTTCKGRLHHLMQTLPENMKREKDNPNVEFVVLDYDSDDLKRCGITLAQWIKETFPEELCTGRLRYERVENKPNFDMSHAKNMAHRLATGDVLCNVDADFYIASNFSKWLATSFEENLNRVVSCYSVTFAEGIRHKLNRLCGVKLVAGGSGGCIAITRHNFENLGGYDEGAFGAWGGGDLNLILRSIKAGLERIKLSSPYLGESINHGNQERVEYFSDANKKISEERLSRGRLVKNIVYYKQLIFKPSPVANPDGNVGCGEVTNHLGEKKVIGPLKVGRESPSPDAIPSNDVAVGVGRTDWAQRLPADRAKGRGIV